MIQLPDPDQSAAKTVEAVEGGVPQDVRQSVDEIIGTPGLATPADPMRDQDVKDREAERELRLTYAMSWFRLLVIQLFMMNLVFVLVGAEKLVYPDGMTLNLYMAGTMTEVFLVVRLIVKYLFPTPTAT